MPHYDLVIVGTGSANSILDQRFADRKVAIVEKGTFGGTCLNVGCIPTKMFVHTADLAAAPAAGARLGVDAELTGVRWRRSATGSSAASTRSPPVAASTAWSTTTTPT